MVVTLLAVAFSPLARAVDFTSPPSRIRTTWLGASSMVATACRDLTSSIFPNNIMVLPDIRQLITTPITCRRSVRLLRRVLRHVPPPGQTAATWISPAFQRYHRGLDYGPQGGPGVFDLGLTGVVWRGRVLRGYVQDSKSVAASFLADQCVEFEATMRLNLRDDMSCSWVVATCRSMVGGGRVSSGDGRGSGGDTHTRGGRPEAAAGVTGGARWLCSCTQRHARQPELLAWIPELDTLSTQILWWWPKPKHWRGNLLLVP